MAFERAIELDSELFEAYEWYGEVCKNTGADFPKQRFCLSVRVNCVPPTTFRWYF